MFLDYENKKFKIHTTNFDFASLSTDKISEISLKFLRAADEARWWDEESNFRYSIIKCVDFADGILCGWLTQQHKLDQHLYDDIKHESVNQIDSYEDRLFVWNLLHNSVTIEWRRFRERPPLTLSLTVSRLENIITDLLKEIKVFHKIRLVPVDFRTSKEEFITIFYENRILRVVADDFGKEIVDDDVVLVNPVRHLEGAMRQLLLHDVEHPSIARFIAEAKADEISDLRKSAFARAALHSGDPVQMKYVDRNNDIRVRRKTEKGEVEIIVPVTTTDTISERMNILEQVVAKTKELDIKEKVLTRGAKGQETFKFDYEESD